MGLLTAVLELPQMLSYMFFPTLTEEEWEQQNIPLYAMVFFFGVVVGMFALAIYMVLRPFLPF